jgi:hypothetical protein
MADQKSARSTLPGVYAAGVNGGITPIDLGAIAACVIWLLLAGGYFLFGGGNSDGSLRFILILMILVLPICLIWVAAMAARSSAVMRAESERLQAAIDALRQAYIAQAQQGRGETPSPMLLKRLDEIVAAQKGLEASVSMIGAARMAEDHGGSVPRANDAKASDDQPVLSLGTPAEALLPPLSTDDFIRALHFPETAEDQAGFAALRRALRDRNAAQLVQAAQDILTLLSQDGIYMDDLRPDLARPELWRAFAQGMRGRSIAPLGGIRDRSSLALAAGRMKQDPIFRDAAHHFLRRFDKSFAEFEKSATDAEITEFAGTRTARAFMLLGRVAGTFD